MKNTLPSQRHSTRLLLQQQSSNSSSNDEQIATTTTTTTTTINKATLASTASYAINSSSSTAAGNRIGSIATAITTTRTSSTSLAPPSASASASSSGLGGGAASSGATGGSTAPIGKAAPTAKYGHGATTQHHHSSSRHHSTRHDKPAELFRTDFITAMKLPDTEVLDDDNYWLIKDAWKQEWEKGVQVPIKPDSLNRPNFRYKNDFLAPLTSSATPAAASNSSTSSATASSSKENNKPNQQQQQQQQPQQLLQPNTIKKLPKKYLCPIEDKNFSPHIHEAYMTHRVVADAATSTCRYDCDELDQAWLQRVNTELVERMGLPPLTRATFERLMENFEQQCYEGLKAAIEQLQSYSIEYDEGVVCDVCRSPDSEDGNEMVFCDGCNTCVHQACYGIEQIPQGAWLCQPCSFGGGPVFRPECVLCPNVGGAMKATRNFRHWAHVSCTIWIPETGFANPDKMEPVVNLNQVAQARWQLVCQLCKEKRGACLQCSEPRCSTAFHVTCAFKHNLEMQTILVDEDSEIEFRAYCYKHSRKYQQKKKLEEEEDDEEEMDEEDEVDDEDEEEEEAQEQDDDDETLYTINNNETTKNEETPAASSTAAVNVSLSNENDQTKFLQSLASLSETERKWQILKRIQQLNVHFYKHVNLDETRASLARMSSGGGLTVLHSAGLNTLHSKHHVDFVFNYWKLKRRFNAQSTFHVAQRPTVLAGERVPFVIPIPNKALMMPKGAEDDLMTYQERLLAARTRWFLKLRQDLERARNLCYMVMKRERLKRHFFDIGQQLFEKQVEYGQRYGSSSNLLQSTAASLSSSPRSGRSRDILQLKNEHCLYDYPALWAPHTNGGLSDDEQKPDLAVPPPIAPVEIKMDVDEQEPPLLPTSKENHVQQATVSKKLITPSKKKAAADIKKKYMHINTTPKSNNNSKSSEIRYSIAAEDKKKKRKKSDEEEEDEDDEPLSQIMTKKLKTTRGIPNGQPSPAPLPLMNGQRRQTRGAVESSSTTSPVSRSSLASSSVSSSPSSTSFTNNTSPSSSSKKQLKTSVNKNTNSKHHVIVESPPPSLNHVKLATTRRSANNSRPNLRSSNGIK